MGLKVILLPKILVDWKSLFCAGASFVLHRNAVELDRFSQEHYENIMRRYCKFRDRKTNWSSRRTVTKKKRQSTWTILQNTLVNMYSRIFTYPRITLNVMLVCDEDLSNCIVNNTELSSI
jgi:hypothetical protein